MAAIGLHLHLTSQCGRSGTRPWLMARELGFEMASAMALAMASRLEASRSGSCMVVPPAKEASGKLKTATVEMPSLPLDP